MARPQTGCMIRMVLALWLTAIARNVCLRWRRGKVAKSAYLAHGALSTRWKPGAMGMAGDGVEILSAQRVSVTLEKALATLPTVTRRPDRQLCGRDAAGRTGRAVGTERGRATCAQLHRGKLTLRQALTPANAIGARWLAGDAHPQIVLAASDGSSVGWKAGELLRSVAPDHVWAGALIGSAHPASLARRG